MYEELVREECRPIAAAPGSCWPSYSAGWNPGAPPATVRQASEKMSRPRGLSQARDILLPAVGGGGGKREKRREGGRAPSSLLPTIIATRGNEGVERDGGNEGEETTIVLFGGASPSSTETRTSPSSARQLNCHLDAICYHRFTERERERGCRLGWQTRLQSWGPPTRALVHSKCTMWPSVIPPSLADSHIDFLPRGRSKCLGFPSQQSYVLTWTYLALSTASHSV